MKRCGLILFGLLALPVPVYAALEDGWRAIADYRAADAVRIFETEREHGGPVAAREADFGRGVALLARQPVTPQQVEKARLIFAALAAGGNDDFGLGARFYLARIAQFHAGEPDEAAAAEFYRQLIELRPDSIWAQTALSRLAILQLYTLDAGSPPAGRIDRAEKLLASARGPGARCELHWLLAEAVLYYRLPVARALPHFVAAEQSGQLRTLTRADVLVQIAELSVITGDKDQARTYFRKFLEAYPRERRCFIVREKLAALTGK